MYILFQNLNSLSILEPRNNPFKLCYKITSLNLRNLGNLGIKTKILSFNLLDSNIHMFNSTAWIKEKKASSKCIRVHRGTHKTVE